MLGSWIRGAVVLVAGGVFVGCTSRASIIPNSDPQLRKTMAQFSADAAKRFPYKADAPRGDEKDVPARAQVNYSPFNRLDIENLSPVEDYKDVEVWIDGRYVIFLPAMERNKMKLLDFKMIYDQEGNPFTIDKAHPRVEKVEILKDGKLYPVPVQIADHF